MSDYVTLTCPSCGGKLQITKDIERFACAHCGNEHVVKRGGGVISLSPVVDGLSKVQAGVDKTASELAIKRLQDEIKELEEEYSDVYKERSGNTGTSVISWILIVVGGLFMISDLIADGTGMSLIGLVVFVIGIITLYNFSKKKKQYNIEMEAILQEARQKKAEIAKHKKVVRF